MTEDAEVGHKNYIFIDEKYYDDYLRAGREFKKNSKEKVLLYKNFKKDTNTTLKKSIG